MKRISEVVATAIFLMLFLITAIVVGAQKPPTNVKQAQEAQIAPDVPQSRPVIFPPPPQDSGAGLFGQEHHYSVTFRGNGEAVVLLKAVFSNPGEEELSHLVFEMPKVFPQNILAYQVIKNPVCVRFRNNIVPLQRVENTEAAFIKDPNCLEYRDPSYEEYLYAYDATFSKAGTTLNGNKLEITLATPLAAGRAGAALIYFRAGGYTEKDIFGVYKYFFETVKADSAITKAHIGISVDADQILKGSKGKVEYQKTFDSAGLKSLEAAAPAAASMLNRYYGEVGQGQIIKEVSNLGQGESYSVRGAYADSIFRLYAQLALLMLLGFVALVIVLILFTTHFLRRFEHTSGPKAGATTTSSVILVIVGSFVLSLLVAGFTAGVGFLLQQLAFYSSQGSSFALFLLVSIFAIFVYLLLVVVPAVVLGFKRGLWWGVGLFTATVMWVALYLIVAVFFLFITRSQSPGYPPVYPMQGGTVDRAVETETAPQVER